MKTFRTGPWKEGHCHLRVRAGSNNMILWVNTERTLAQEVQRQSPSRKQKASLQGWKEHVL